MEMARKVRPAGRRKRPRGPGRPAGGDAAVREALLETARGLFLARGFASVTIRQIAAAAGSSPAMIHYYFGDKLGLYRAMLDEAFTPVAAAFQRIRDTSSGATPGIASLVRVYMNMLAANPWVPALIVQEVLAQGGQFRPQFIEHFAARLAPLVVEALRSEQAKGLVRADVDPRLAAVSAVSLSVFPFLALPVTSRVFGLSTKGDALQRLTTHTTRVLLEGIGTPEPAR
jgi:AcrR family transcriptional regulator